MALAYADRLPCVDLYRVLPTVCQRPQRTVAQDRDRPKKKGLCLRATGLPHASAIKLMASVLFRLGDQSSSLVPDWRAFFDSGQQGGCLRQGTLLAGRSSFFQVHGLFLRSATSLRPVSWMAAASIVFKGLFPRPQLSGLAVTPDNRSSVPLFMGRIWMTLPIWGTGHPAIPGWRLACTTNPLAETAFSNAIQVWPPENAVSVSWQHYD